MIRVPGRVFRGLFGWGVFWGSFWCLAGFSGLFGVAFAAEWLGGGFPGFLSLSGGWFPVHYLLHSDCSA